MKVSPCFDQTIKVLSISDDETFDNRKFKRVEIEVYNYIATPKGRVKFGTENNSIIIWEELYRGLPELNVGDIIEGEIVSVLCSRHLI